MQQHDRGQVARPRRRELDHMQSSAGDRHELAGWPMRTLEPRDADGGDRRADAEDRDDRDDAKQEHEASRRARGGR
jgi:hypothetical protein